MQEYALRVHVAVRMAVTTAMRVSTNLCLGMVMRMRNLLAGPMIMRLVSV